MWHFRRKLPVTPDKALEWAPWVNAPESLPEGKLQEQSCSSDRSWVLASECELRIMYNQNTLECPSAHKIHSTWFGDSGLLPWPVSSQGWKRSLFLCSGTRWRSGLVSGATLLETKVHYYYCKCMWLNSDKLRVMRLQRERDVFLSCTPRPLSAVTG